MSGVTAITHSLAASLYRFFYLYKMHLEVEIEKGYKCLIDIEDFDRLNGAKIYLSKNYHTDYCYIKYEGKKVALHRFITDCPPDKIVDHKNRNGLDNRKCNLRVCEYFQNSANTVAVGKVDFKGVTVVKRRNGKIVYRAAINKHGKRKYLGYYENPIDAARAYDKAAIKMHGEFANLNFK